MATNKRTSNKKSKIEKSLNVAIEQMAQLLRSQLKLEKRSVKILPSSKMPASFYNSLEQLAHLLRKQIQGKKK